MPEERLAEVFDVSSFFNVELACRRPHRFLQLAATFASLFIRRARQPLKPSRAWVGPMSLQVGICVCVACLAACLRRSLRSCSGCIPAVSAATEKQKTLVLHSFCVIPHTDTNPVKFAPNCKFTSIFVILCKVFKKIRFWLIQFFGVFGAF